MLEHSTVVNRDKDVHDVLNAACVGVDLIEGTRWAIPGGRLWGLLDALIGVSGVLACLPGAVAAFLGGAQRYDLLRRLRLRVVESVCMFCTWHARPDGDFCAMSVVPLDQKSLPAKWCHKHRT